MKKELKELIEKISSNQELKNKLKNVKTVNEILLITKDVGFDLSEKDLNITKEVLGDGIELSNKELEKVSGGGGCGCLAGGYGKGENKVGRFECVCVAYGAGGYFPEGYEGLWKPEEMWGGGEGLCVCPLAGAGATNEDGC